MDIQKTLNLVSSYLKQDGVFIFSWDHPFMHCIEAFENTLIFSGSYFEEEPFTFKKNINVPADRNNPDLNKESEYSLTLYSRRLSDYINILAKAGFAVERVIEETDRKTLDNDYALVHDFTHLIKPKNFLNQLFLSEEIVNEIYEHNFNAKVQFSLKKRLEIPFIPPLQTEAERKSRSVSFHIRAKNFG